jgi:hypothetical protein
MQEYCKNCKLQDNSLCLSNYKNPTATLESAIKQANNKGEWPCTFSPHRATFIDSFRPGGKIRIVKEGN